MGVNENTLHGWLAKYKKRTEPAVILNKHGLIPVTKVKHVITTNFNHKKTVFANLLERNFAVSSPVIPPEKEYAYHSEFKTHAEAMLGIFDYIEAWYNNERIHTTLGGLSPNEFEALYPQKRYDWQQRNYWIEIK